MPVRTEKKGKCVKVSTPNRVHAKCTTPKKAAAQKRIIEAADRRKT